eukprot:CAMPEP_0177687194 /NCGR_PEP_ID=MMETSP0447-20121125/33987_1 /TAXON_ID=0 /ORGANISM="Stygamoeba regulata, Strain BSH-02190019" /LENGTH=1000 /DNA_ID=CAMNT_0019197397 /DNA_START=84 /DNA_END=3086 /DNA_ORIENTATION=-
MLLVVQAQEVLEVLLEFSSARGPKSIVKQSFLARLEPGTQGSHPVWKSRWITLTPVNLAVYPAMISKQHEMIQVYATKSIRELEFGGASQERPHTFSFTTAAGKVFLSATCAEERDDWVRALRDIIPQAKLQAHYEILERKAVQQVAKESRELQRQEAVNKVIQLEGSLLQLPSYPDYCRRLQSCLRDWSADVDKLQKLGAVAAITFAQTCTNMVNTTSCAIASCTDEVTRAQLRKHCSALIANASEVLSLSSFDHRQNDEIRLEFEQSLEALREDARIFSKVIDVSLQLAELASAIVDIRMINHECLQRCTRCPTIVDRQESPPDYSLLNAQLNSLLAGVVGVAEKLKKELSEERIKNKLRVEEKKQEVALQQSDSAVGVPVSQLRITPPTLQLEEFAEQLFMLELRAVEVFFVLKAVVRFEGLCVDPTTGQLPEVATQIRALSQCIPRFVATLRDGRGMMTANEQREYRFRLCADLELVMATVEQLIGALTAEAPKPNKKTVRAMISPRRGRSRAKSPSPKPGYTSSSPRSPRSPRGSPYSPAASPTASPPDGNSPLTSPPHSPRHSVFPTAPPPVHGHSDQQHEVQSRRDSTFRRATPRVSRNSRNSRAQPILSGRGSTHQADSPAFVAAASEAARAAGEGTFSSESGATRPAPILSPTSPRSPPLTHEAALSPVVASAPAGPSYADRAIATMHASRLSSPASQQGPSRSDHNEQDRDTRAKSPTASTSSAGCAETEQGSSASTSAPAGTFSPVLHQIQRCSADLEKKVAFFSDPTSFSDKVLFNAAKAMTNTVAQLFQICIDGWQGSTTDAGTRRTTMSSAFLNAIKHTHAVVHQLPDLLSEPSAQPGAHIASVVATGRCLQLTVARFLASMPRADLRPTTAQQLDHVSQEVFALSNRLESYANERAILDSAAAATAAEDESVWSSQESMLRDFDDQERLFAVERELEEARRQLIESKSRVNPQRSSEERWQAEFRIQQHIAQLEYTYRLLSGSSP